MVLPSLGPLGFARADYGNKQDPDRCRSALQSAVTMLLKELLASCGSPWMIESARRQVCESGLRCAGINHHGDPRNRSPWNRLMDRPREAFDARRRARSPWWQPNSGSRVETAAS